MCCRKQDCDGVGEDERCRYLWPDDGQREDEQGGGQVYNIKDCKADHKA